MDFLEIEPRETAGAQTSGKYDYQKDMSICLLLEHHSNDQDYVFVFDYHDDLVVLNSELIPDKYSFYQIKGKDSGAWTINSILKRKKVKRKDDDKEYLLNSILGKLYLHKKNFKEKAIALNFISNASFSCNLKSKKDSKDLTKICIEELANEEEKSIKERLGAEFNDSSLDSEFSKLTFLKVNNLSVKESSTHTKGKLSEFLHKVSKGKKFNPELVYQNLFDDIKKKTAHSKRTNSFEEFIQTKCISKSYFDNILNVIGEGKDFDKIWQEVSANLRQANVPFGKIANYNSLWKQFEIERMQPNNSFLKEIVAKTHIVKESIKPEDYSQLDLIEVVEMIKSKLNIDYTKVPISEKYLETIIFAELHD